MAQPLVALPMSIPAPEIHADLMAPRPDPRRDPGPESDPPTDHIIRSKVQPPVVRDSTIGRVRLLDWLNEHAADRVRVVAAEAGYGKTTLLAHWAGRLDTDVRWLKLDPTDADWSTFISYLVAAFREGDPTFGRATLRLLGHLATLGTTMEQALGQFLAELGRSIDRPTLLIIDDLQHVHGNADVRTIIGRLVERAPTSLTFLLSGRSRLDLRLGRQTAQGNVTSLGTDDLRFTRQEIEDLFTHGYRMALDGDLVSMVEARTEGWAASLQLLYSTLRNQSPSEIRDFIEALRGGHEPLYDFLAEEVLERQPHTMQQVLLHASILDRIAPELVVAALSATDEPLPLDTVVASLDLADELGLMSRNSMGSSRRRFHPLLQEFLQSHLVATTPKAQYRLIHLTVAKAAEGTHWPTAAHHFIEADAGEEAMRVIGDASITVLGSGQWGTALELTDRIPSLEPSVRLQVIRGRGMVASGDAPNAIAMLSALAEDPDTRSQDAPLVKLALASALAGTERVNEVPAILRDLVADETIPVIARSLAKVWLEMYTSSDALTVAGTLSAFARLAEHHELFLYAGIAHLNRGNNLLAHGDNPQAKSASNHALRMLSQIPDYGGHAAAVYSTLAQAAFEEDDFEQCLGYLRKSSDAFQPGFDAWCEAAILLEWLGRSHEAATSISRALGLANHIRSPAEQSVLLVAQSVAALASGDGKRAKSLVEAASTTNYDANLTGMVLFVRGVASAVTDDRASALVVVRDALAQARARSLHRWAGHLALLEASLHPQAESLRTLVEDSAGVSDAVVLASADVIGMSISWPVEPHSRLGRLIRQWPSRWRPVLRRALSQSSPTTARFAADLLGEVGEAEDVPAISTWEQKVKRRRDARVSVALAKRISPTLRIHDLGRTVVTLGQREVRLSDVRRRSASLLLYLVSRPRQTATREQVLDALWPDLDPAQSGNSLHQTLYFLRRDLIPEDTIGNAGVEYVPMEAEMLYLEPTLVHVDSVAFVRQGLELANRGPASYEVPRLLDQYRGQFAPEFEYEEWAIPWRAHAHGLFLHLSEQYARQAIAAGRPGAATQVLEHALETDPGATELRPLMVVALHRSGSVAAARHAYRQLRDQAERDFEDPVAPLADLLDSFPPAQEGGSWGPPPK